MNEARRVFTTMMPLMSPSPVPKASAARMASSGGSESCCPKRYIDQLVSPTMAPTERSNWPPIMSRVTPTATMPNWAARLVAGTNVAVLRKSGVAKLKKMSAATTPAMEASSGRISARRRRACQPCLTERAPSPPLTPTGHPGMGMPHPGIVGGALALGLLCHLRRLDPFRAAVDAGGRGAWRRDRRQMDAAPSGRPLQRASRPRQRSRRRRGSGRSGSSSPAPGHSARSGRAAARRCSRANIPAGRW